MKFRVTRHHSTGKATRFKDSLYPGVLFPHAHDLHLFVETQDDEQGAAPDEGGIAISFVNNEWHIKSLVKTAPAQKIVVKN